VATRLAVGASLVALALALRGWAQATLRDHGITPEKLGATVTPTSYAKTGPYRALRHPLYAGHLLLIAGVGLLSLGWGGVTLALAALPHFAHRAAEEDAHRAKMEPVIAGRRVVRAA
jgi:protein-S-isoprenylcysteine O-methyltransferase Ste14